MAHNQFRLNSLRDNNEHGSSSLDNLKNAVLALDPSGAQGFEGLIGTALAEIVGIPFRLANSGVQFGVDGTSSSTDSSISYECKRYSDSVPREPVMAKVGELSIASHDVDLWILCATSVVAAQLVDDVSQFGRTHAVSTIVLDWSDTSTPPLAVLLAMARDKVIKFLKRHVHSTEPAIRDVISELEIVAKDPTFDTHATRIRQDLENPMLGLAAAREANKTWLIDTFSSRERARSRLGQPLSPYDENHRIWHPRRNLTSVITPLLTGSSRRGVLYVVGSEGVGKSWALAESWCTTLIKPLMAFIPPDRFADSADQIDVQDVIVSALIEQTDVGRWPTVKGKWFSILERWRKLRSNRIRCVVVVDGIDQRPGKDWVRILGKLADVIASYDCQLIVTVRTSYYRRVIEPSLYLPYEEVTVSEWTAEERRAILSRVQIQDEDLKDDVAAALRNPRILGIALRLWSAESVSNLNELSTSRLLFEHIRTTSPYRGPGYDSHSVVRIIRDHAERVASGVRDSGRRDLRVFQSALQTVVEERFFSFLENDPTSYRISEEGLSLGLSFLLLDHMRIADRNDRDLDEELWSIIEPISALGMTASVVLAAITVACVDQEQTTEAGAAALIRIFAETQNPGDAHLRQLARLATDWPGAFASAARVLCYAGGGQPNLDLIGGALVQASLDTNAWTVICEHIQSWLSDYSVCPPPRPRMAIDERQQRQCAAESEFRTRSDRFSDAEKVIMDSLRETDGDVDTLWRLTFQLLAGRGLNTAARMLVRWTFSASLYPGHLRSDRTFFHLIRLNRVDWHETRTALLREAAVLRSHGVSPTGKWAIVCILRATGDPRDAHAARQLVEQLTADQQRVLQHWRLVEDYCESDPCDPSSMRPTNVGPTSAKYIQIDVGRFQQWRRTQEHLFFDMARPAMARFDISVAANKHREYVDSIILTADLAWRPDLADLCAHNALVSNDSVVALRNLVLSIDNARQNGEKDDLWLVIQHLMLLSFPFLSGVEQFELLMHSGMEPMLHLVENLQALNEDTFDRHLETACRSGREPAQFALLLLASETATLISVSSRRLIADLLDTGSDRVRAQALGLIARICDPTLVAAVARSGWRASKDMPYDESCYGARVLALAAHDRVIPFTDALNRMATRDYGMASGMWTESSAVREITARIDRSIRHVAALTDDLEPPAIEIRVRQRDRFRPRIAAAVDRLFPRDHFYGDDEANDLFQENTERIRSFSTELQEMGCDVIIDHFDLGEFRSIVSADKRMAHRWRDIFIGSSQKKLRILHNLVLLLGHGLSESDPTHAATMFKLVMNQEPMIPVRYGSAGVSLDSLAIWGGPNTEILNLIRDRRLDEAASDDVLSKETLAAHISGQQHVLREYIERNLNKGEPAAISRAVMVAGFSDWSQYNESVLSNYDGTEGFVGVASTAAKYAYERNLWARHWFGRMCQATDPRRFWRCSVLFLKVVDGRYDFWFDEYGDHSEAMRRFWPNLRGSLDNRIKKWRRKRESKLFGTDRPDDVFVSPIIRQ